jgi:selenocysteine-specific elongation factor
MPAEERRRCDRLLAALAAGGATPPDEGELQGVLGLPAAQVKRSLLLLDARHEVMRAGPHWFHGAWIEGARKTLADLAKRTGGFTASEAREALGTTRKYVIPLLEALDEKGFTKRVGDRRVLR